MSPRSVRRRNPDYKTELGVPCKRLNSATILAATARMFSPRMAPERCGAQAIPRYLPTGRIDQWTKPIDAVGKTE